MNTTTTSPPPPPLSRPPIRLLPDFLIDQIKAGEIIERPANLIKEVVENSIDALASKIEIHLLENGLKQITIRDDGVGVPLEELPQAFCRHATSKIEKFQDLYELHSFGFRGEALASIAAIARVTCTSRCRDFEGGQISLTGGKIQEGPIPLKGLPYGTLLIIENLFLNTPARLKFIKSQSSEKNALMRTLRSFFVSHPQVEFHLKWDRAEKSIFRPSDRFQRFTQTLPGNRWRKEDFHFVQREYEGLSFSGLYAKTAKKSGQGRNQYFFVNKRLIQDKSLHYIVSSALENCWPAGTSAPYLFELELPPEQVDVNVHPNKTMVKFATPSIVHSLIHSSLKKSVQPSLAVRGEPVNDAERESEDIKKSHFDSYEKRNSATATTPCSLPIGQRYRIFLPPDGDPFVVDGPPLLRWHIDSIRNHFTAEEGVPLMVGIPFQDKEIVSKIRAHKHWEQDHFEFDLLAEDLIVLKLIPRALISLPQRATVFYLMGDNEYFERELAANPLLPSVLRHLLEEYSKEQLRECHAIISLDENSLSKLFEKNC